MHEISSSRMKKYLITDLFHETPNYDYRADLNASNDSNYGAITHLLNKGTVAKPLYTFFMFKISKSILSEH